MNEQPQPIQPLQPASPTPATPPTPPVPPSQSGQAPVFFDTPQPEAPVPQPGIIQPGQPQSYDQASQQTGQGQASYQPGTPQQAVPAKDKTVAILLAIFLGFWTWLYTYQKDSKKFWINLGLSVVTLGFWSIPAWIWSIIDTVKKSDSYYLNFPNQSS